MLFSAQILNAFRIEAKVSYVLHACLSVETSRAHSTISESINIVGKSVWVNVSSFHQNAEEALKEVLSDLPCLVTSKFRGLGTHTANLGVRGHDVNNGFVEWGLPRVKQGLEIIRVEGGNRTKGVEIARRRAKVGMNGGEPR